MTLHIHGTIVTQYGVAANNRAENEGNITTLQKILWNGELHSSVSAEAIRFALRLLWQKKYDETQDDLVRVNRRWNEEKQDFDFEDLSFSAETYIDDDVMGYMNAEAPKEEKEDSKKGGRAKGTTTARRGALEVSRAVSLYPYFGETTFNARGGEKGRTSLYGSEVHATSYQYSFSLTPTELKRPERAKHVLEAFCSLNQVGGNHGRFLYDFSPLVVLFRVTHDPAPRILYIFEQEIGEPLRMGKLIERVNAGDIDAEELILGGSMPKEETEWLKEQGAVVVPGVKQALAEACERITKRG